MILHRLESIGKAVQQLHRYREVVSVFLKYGYEDLAHRLHLPAAIDRSIKGIKKNLPNIAAMPPPERLRSALEELGPTFIKMGQILSTRSDLLPDSFTSELAKLQDQVTPIPYSEVRDILERELNRPIEEVFEGVDSVPLGSASIAQVHKAILRDGTAAVVKVQKPGVQELVSLDLSILHHLAALMETHVESWRVHRPTEIVNLIERTLKNEIDFLAEAAQMERFRWQFATDPVIYVPKVCYAATTTKVLTMEHIPGIKVSALLATNPAPFDRSEIARRISDLVMKQIFIHGFFHADPHPGNIHILPGQVIAFLDFGMMGYLDQRGREAFVDLIGGVARRNEISVTNALLKLTSADSEPPRQGLEAEVAEFMHRHFYRPIKEIHFAKLLNQLFQLTSRHGLRIPPDFFIMVKSLALTECLVRELDPDHSIIEQAEPFVKNIRMARIQPNRFFEGLFEFGTDMTELARESPAEIRRILSQLKTGKAKVVFQPEGLDLLISSADRVSNRLSFSVVLASLIIGSSLIVHADIPPKWNGLPMIGLLGYLLAAVMGFWLLVSILRHGRM